jgi:hypothetical protein
VQQGNADPAMTLWEVTPIARKKRDGTRFDPVF